MYIRTKGRFGILTTKVDNVDEACKVHGINKAEVVESKVLSTNRHTAVVEFSDIIDAIPTETQKVEPAASIPAKVPKTTKTPVAKTVPVAETTVA
jgi:hypothetical protein